MIIVVTFSFRLIISLNDRHQRRPVAMEDFLVFCFHFANTCLPLSLAHSLILNESSPSETLCRNSLQKLFQRRANKS